jgi:shikimate kinase
MEKKNIVLIGFMAAGKTMIGRALARRLKRPFFSTDVLVEEKEKRTIRQIFEQSGEAYFRSVENGVVKQLANQQGVIIDCGGGVVLNNENFTELRKNGIIIHLKASPEVVYQRIKGESNRPLLNVPDPLARVRELYEQRLPLYNQADMVVDVSSSSIEGPVDEILNKVADV